MRGELGLLTHAGLVQLGLGEVFYISKDRHTQVRLLQAGPIQVCPLQGGPS